MIETRSASTALNKHKCLQQFFKWLVLDEEEIDRSPMERVRQPKHAEEADPDPHRRRDTSKLLDACKGKSFVDLRDEAIIRLFYNTGARLSEVGNLQLDDVDLHGETVRFHGKGAKDRRVRIGPKTGRAISRYLRARAEPPRSRPARTCGWPNAAAGRSPPNGIKIRLKHARPLAGVADVHAHRWRHSFAHEWKLAGGDTGDLMLLLGWTLRRHAPPLRRQRRRRTRPTDPGTARHRRARIARSVCLIGAEVATLFEFARIGDIRRTRNPVALRRTTRTAFPQFRGRKRWYAQCANGPQRANRARAGSNPRPDTTHNCAPSGRLSLAVDVFVGD